MPNTATINMRAPVNQFVYARAYPKAEDEEMSPRDFPLMRVPERECPNGPTVARSSSCIPSCYVPYSRRWSKKEQRRLDQRKKKVKTLEGPMIYSPFPGMDPYLEASNIWPDVHTRLMNIIGEQLTPLLVPKYLAELETQIVIDRVDDDPQMVLPDVSVTSPDVSAEASSGIAVVAPAPVQVPGPMGVPTRLVTVYIRQRETARLVAVIELLSPVNKRLGKGREEYLEKRRAFLTAPVHLIEIDLLRSYPRMPFDDPLPPAHYLVMVCKAGERSRSSVWPITVRQPLPTIPIPVLSPDPPVPLELGQALRTAYERARYDLRVDYRKPPIPPLSPADAAWAATLLGAPGGMALEGDR